MSSPRVADVAKQHTASIFQVQRCNSRFTSFFCAALSVAMSSTTGLQGYFIDVGAAFGTEILIVRQATAMPAIGFECRVEEYTRVAQKLKQDPNVTVVHACVSDACGMATLYRATDSSSMMKANVRGPAESHKARSEHQKVELVPKVTLDSVVSDMGVPAVGMIKIDTQGHEPAVLRGAAETIRRCRPFLFFECDPKFGCRSGEHALQEANLTGYACECWSDCFCRDVQRV